ncbi:MAG: hypothetical protein KBC96_12595 [Armatimonadetes bacterium]|nr:hypothetical protein [Armatimonadota bacterium]
MRPRLWIPVILAGAATAIILSRNSESEASWVIRRACDDGFQHCFSATARTSVSSCGNTVASTMEIVHGVADRCRMEYTSGPLKGTVMSSDGNEMRTYDPTSHTITVTPSVRCSRLGDRLDLLLANHRVTSTGIKTIAGRPAHLIVVRGNRSRTILKRLWIDAETYAVLGQEDRDCRGRVRSSTHFVSIRFEEAIPDNVFELPKDSRMISRDAGDGTEMTPGQLSRELGFKVRMPGYVPKGFELESCRLHSCSCEFPHRCACIRYTNGVTSISLFQSKSTSARPCSASCEDARKGSCVLRKSDQGNAATVTRDGISHVVLGDLPGPVITKVADSLR